ncbi:hypothetical protein N7488_004644 [Penicillium malachiteum]|nr:hypothetical protein N7488_004644 [Penicillium malachiteum]
MRNIPGLLRLTQIKAADEESDLDSNILLKTYVANENFGHSGTESVVWLQDVSSKDESFVYILQLNTRVANGGRIEGIRILSVYFSIKSENDNDSPLKGLWRVEDLCKGSYNPELYELFRKEPVPYEPIVTWDDNSFGQTLIKVDIVRNPSTRRRTYFHGHLAELRGRPLGVPSALQSILLPSIEEIWLRRRWISTLRSYSTFFTQYLGSILYSVKTLPWLFTFLLDFPIQKLVALIRRHPVIGTAVMASLLYIGHPYSSVQLVVFLYLGCKCLPRRLLLIIQLKEFPELA